MIACSISNHLCPHCHHTSYTELWQCEDYLVSHERYVIGRCNHCGLIQTLSAPSINELGKYYESSHYQSHKTERKSLVARIYGFVKRLRIKQRVALVQRLIATIPQGVDSPLTSHNMLQMLEVGAGVGDFAQAMQRRGYRAYVVEQSQIARAECATKIPIGQIFPATDVFASTTQLYGQLDLICLWHSLEHLPDLAEQLASYNRLLKPRGTLCIAVPNAQSFDASYYRELWAGYDVPRHLWHFTPHSLRQTVEAYGFELAGIYAQRLDLYYIALLSESYRQGGRINLIAWIKAFGVGCSYHLRSLFTPMRSSALLYHFVRKT